VPHDSIIDKTPLQIELESDRWVGLCPARNREEMAVPWSACEVLFL